MSTRDYFCSLTSIEPIRAAVGSNDESLLWYNGVAIAGAFYPYEVGLCLPDDRVALPRRANSRRASRPAASPHRSSDDIYKRSRRCGRSRGQSALYGPVSF